MSAPRETTYHVRAPPYAFKAVVSYQNRGRFIRIVFGGEKSCVQFGFDRSEKHPYMTSFGYDADCVLDSSPHAGIIELNTLTQLQPSTGTVVMLRTALWFVYKLFPNKKDVMFKDTSHLRCRKGSRGEPVRLELHNLYLAKYSQTWYQRKVGAYPVEYASGRRDVNATTALTAYERFVTTANGNMPSFNDFVSTYVTKKKYFKSAYLSKLLPFLREAYTTSSSWQEFFSRLAETDCRVFEHWLGIFIDKHCPLKFHEQEWAIPRAHVPEYPSFSYVVVQEGAGGRRHDTSDTMHGRGKEFYVDQDDLDASRDFPQDILNDERA